MNKNIINKIMGNLSKEYDEMRSKKEKYLNTENPKYVQIYNEIFAAKIIVANHFDMMDYKPELIMRVAELCHQKSQQSSCPEYKAFGSYVTQQVPNYGSNCGSNYGSNCGSNYESN